MREPIEKELARLEATEDVSFEFDDEFEPEAGRLLKVEIGPAEWRLWPERFLQLLGDLADGVGGEAIKRAIEQHAFVVWHGPSPPDSRDRDA